jgi:hypothetical protein
VKEGVDDLRKFRILIFTQPVPSTESVLKAINMKRKDIFVTGKALSYLMDRN